MRITEVLKEGPHFLRSFALFLFHPRDFVDNKHGFDSLRANLWKVALCSVGLVILLVKLYHVVLGPSLVLNAEDALASQEPSDLSRAQWPALTSLGLSNYVASAFSTNTYVGTRLPVLRKIALFTSWGFAIERKTGIEARMKSAGKVDAQSIEVWRNALGFECGFVTVWFENIEVEDLKLDATLILLVFTYALATTLSIYFPARLLGGTRSMKTTLNFGVLLYFFSLVFMVLSNLVISLIVFKVFKLRAGDYASTATTNMPFGAYRRTTYIVETIWLLTGLPLIRSYWIGFQEFFSLTARKFVSALALSILSGAVIIPVIFIPAIYFIVRFAKVWAAIF